MSNDWLELLFTKKKVDLLKQRFKTYLSDEPHTSKSFCE